MYRRTALKLPLLLAAGTALARKPRAAAAEASRWSADRANNWYQAQGFLVGANYITSNAINQLEMFQADTFDPRRIDTELGWASSCGLNAVRVFLHDQLWDQDHRGFQRRLAQFVGIAARRRIKPLFVLFDSCWDPRPKLGRQHAPTPGVHNSGWMQSPGAERLYDGRTRVLHDYVTGVLTQFRDDDRVLGWDLWNEPDNPAREYSEFELSDKQERVADLLPRVFRWAREVDPRQPLTSAVWGDGNWGDSASRSTITGIQLDNSDVVSFHCYDKPASFESRVTELAPLGRPMLCTEYLARTRGSTIAGILPIAKRHNVAAINWGLVAGKTQTYYPWDSWDQPYTTIPKEWFHDLLLADGRPYRSAEIQTIRGLVRGDS